MARASKPRSGAGVKRAPAKRAPRKAAAGSRGITPQECLLDETPPDASDATRRIEQEGGVVLATYRDPLGANPMILAVLPVDRIEPTPFQRDLSDAHHKKLSGVIDRTGLFLDPLIAITAPERGFWTPNGRHRLEAMSRLGARAITAIVIPRRE